MVRLNIWVKRILFLLAAAAAVKYLSPFIIALGAAAVMEPVLRRLRERTGISRGFASAVGTVMLYGLFGSAAVFLCWRGALWLYSTAKALPAKLAPLPALLQSGEDGLERFIIAAPEELQGYLRAAAESIRSGAERLPGQIYENVLRRLGSVFSAAPRITLFFAAAAIGTFFISAGYDDVRRFIWRQVPGEKRLSTRDAVYEAARAVKRWFVSELTITAVSFAELLMFFLILGVETPIFGALAVALIDALPLVGTGIILVPWALLCFISGESGKTFILIAAYITVAVVRSLLEPKILGEQSGPHPAASLIAIYLGFRFMGVTGMLLFPLALMVVKRLHDGGYIKLWK